MKRFLILAFCLLSLRLSAQTDVTSTYLKNAGFDEASCFVSTNVVTYAKDISNGEVSGCQPVTDWCIDDASYGDSKAGGCFRFGSGCWMAGSSYVVPAADSEGSTSGGVLGLAGCWSGSAGYSQEVALPVGFYRLSYKVYNAGADIPSNYTNAIGYIEEDGTAHYATSGFPSGEWTEGEVFFSLALCSFGQVHIGYICANVGSANSPKLFVDYIKLEKYDSSELTGGDFTSCVDPSAWEGSETYTEADVLAKEMFQWATSLPLGRYLSQTITGLPNGKYTVSVYAGASSTSERDNTEYVITDGATSYVSFHANDASVGIPAFNRTVIETLDVVTLSNVEVKDGTLTMYLQEDVLGPNWLVLQIKSLVLESSSLEGIPSEWGYYVGDVNADKAINVADVTGLVSIILGSSEQTPPSDVNNDGQINVADVTSLVSIILGSQEQTYVNTSADVYSVYATVYAEQSLEENLAGTSGVSARVVNPYTLKDVSAAFDVQDFFTTLDINCSAISNISSVSIYANNKEPIAGILSLRSETSTIRQLSGKAPSVYANSMSSDVVTVTGSGTTFRAFLFPVDLTGGVTVTVRTTSGEYYSQTFPEAIEAFSHPSLTFSTQGATRNLWMSTIPGNTYFSMLSTPAAHDAATSGVGSIYAYFAKCQSESLQGLLDNGVRAFDLRPRYNSSRESDIKLENLEIYHGIVATGVKFKDAIDILINFVKTHPTEAVSVIMSKEGVSGTDYSETWRNSMRECFLNDARKPYLMGDVRGYHTLDDVRGKVSIVSRNPYGNASNNYRDVIVGAYIENWPDKGSVTDYGCPMTQAWNWVDCYANVEDAYEDSDAEKKVHVQEMLDLASANTSSYRYHYTYTSIAGALTSSLTSHANVMNPWTANYITNSLTGPTGYVYADYMGSSSYGGSALLKAIIGQNYKYVYQGRSRVR
ncbi:MAG: hypothetical protein IK000_07560 [Bacteroidaceae bacterium]|nr:hypothetical protein [Bacteroidaceae bacterium]